MSVIQFVIGLIIPYVASALLLLGVRHLTGRDNAAQAWLPIVVVTVLVIAAILLWQSHRWVSYGLITALSLAVLVAGGWWLKHTGSKTSSL